MSTDTNDPATWPTSSAIALCIGLDVGIAQDHSALVIGGAWQSSGRQIVGIIQTQQFLIGTPLDEVADQATALAKHLRCRIVFDCSNNSAFASLLAARLGSNPANALVAGVITNALGHASQPVAMQLSLAGQLATIPRWTLSKRELVETTSTEIDSGTLRIGQSGDWEALKDELVGMERTVRQSGAVTYSAPAGRHDDLVMALSLCLFGIRRVAALAGRRRHVHRPRFSAAAWT
jgi:hypothetical protein